MHWSYIFLALTHRNDEIIYRIIVYFGWYVLILLYTKLAAWSHKFTYMHAYIDTYMHARICVYFNGGWIYEHFMMIFVICHLHIIPCDCQHYAIRFVMMFNFECTLWYSNILPCTLILPEHVLCITITTCFVINDEINMLNQSIIKCCIYKNPCMSITKIYHLRVTPNAAKG